MGTMVLYATNITKNFLINYNTELNMCLLSTKVVIMTQKDKDLLLKDLCSRLPYGVICADKYVDEKFTNKWNILAIDTTFGNRLSQVCISNCEVTYGYKTSIANIKPYLFPLSSMTEEQKEDLLLTVIGKEGLKLFSVTKDGIISNDKEEQSIESFCFNNINFSNETTEAYINWLNKNHFDYRGLIEKSLAIDATGLNIY